MSTVARVVIADRLNRIVAETDAIIGELSWRRNKVGRMRLTLPKTDPIVREDYLRYGNRLMVELNNGLRPWGGTFDPPRNWKTAHVTLTAYSAEYLLKYRCTDRGRYFSQETAGQIFTALLTEANSVADTGIVVGNVWGGGDAHSPEYHFQSLLDIIQKSICGRLEQADFEVTVAEEGGRLKFYAHLYERMGATKPNVVLEETRNVVDATYREQGPIVNHWHMAGADTGTGTGWGANRLVSADEYGLDRTSRNKYGLREDSEVHNDVVTQTTIDRIAENRLAETAEPHNMLDVTVRDAKPGRYADYRLGDVVRVLLPSYGFDGVDALYRVDGRSFKAQEGTCKLVVREWYG